MPTAQKMKFSIKDFVNECDQIRRKLRIWSYLLKKSLIENFFVQWTFRSGLIVTEGRENAENME